MTDEQIYEILMKLDQGYKITIDEERALISVKQLRWSGIALLPRCMDELVELIDLDLSENHYITDISALYGLASLKKLSLSFTSVRDISVLSSLTNLTTLDLSRNGNLTNISSLVGLRSLTYLDLHLTSVSSIAGLSNLKCLTYLDLSDTMVSDIHELSGLTSLTYLNICNSKVIDIYMLSGLTRLTHLDLSRNNLVYNIHALSRLTDLTYLNLCCTSVSNIGALSGLTRLVHLDLSRTNTIYDIGALYRLTKLTYLDLSNTKVRNISVLSKLNRLVHLGLRATCVNDISVLSDLIGLKYLDLRATGISDISALSGLTDLSHLDLRATGVRDISALSKLTQLTQLNLCYTSVNDVSVLSNLKRLTNLDLRGLNISQIPESLVSLGLEFIFDETPNRRKSGIYMHELTLTDQPIEIFRRGRKSILEYYRFQKSGSSPINECKVVFLGDGGAGKTLIINRLMHDGEKPINFTGESTPGVYISSKMFPIDGEKIELHFWDFGGQEIMHSMHRLFLTHRTLYVVVANARDNKANGQAKYWIRNIKSFADGAPVFLVINQKDQYPGVSINRNGLEKEYPALKDIKIISALNDDTDAFNEEIKNAICKIVSGMESVHTLFARTWLSLMNNLQEMENDYITSDAFYSMCKEKGIETSNDILDVIINWYQDLGVCFYSRKNPASEQYMVLKPRWLLNALYILVFNGRQFTTNGVISEKSIYDLILESKPNMEVRKVWDDIKYEAFQVQYIINVLLNFELVYRLAKGQYQGEDHYFIPMLCDENEPATIETYENDEETIHISFQYTYLPENIIHRLMVRHGDELDLNMVWRTGAAFERKSCKWNALVRIKDDTLDVYVKARNQDIHPANTYLEMIRESIYDINRLYGFKAEEYISYQRDGIEDRFNYKMLMGTRENGVKQVYSTVFQRMVLIDEILGVARYSPDAMTKDVIELILSSLVDMSKRCVDFEDKSEEEITRDVEASIKQILNDKYQIQIAREYTIGRAKKRIGETDLYFYRQKNGKTENLYILENKNLHTYDFKKQYEQLMGYLNPDFVAGITLSISKKRGWEEAFDKIEDNLREMKAKEGMFAPIHIRRKTGINRTQYIKSEHIVPETNRLMTVYHLVLQISDEARKSVALNARQL